MISYDDFKKLDLRIATILKAGPVTGSEKLVRLEVDLGESFNTAQDRKRQIVAGIIKQYPPEQLVGRQVIIIANLEPRKLMGLESNGMLLAADSSDGPVLIMPERKTLNGAIIK